MKARIDNRQQGFVSIFSVLIIMVLLTLVAIGFSNITRSAQKRTLDNQLNTQAFYAAESGINDAMKYIEDKPDYEKNNCDYDLPNASPIIDSKLGIEYTCVLVSGAADLRFDSVNTIGNGKPATGIVQSKNGESIKEFTLSWTGPENTTVTIPTASNDYPRILPKAADYGTTNLGMLRIDLVPIGAGELLPENMAKNSYGFYVYPSTVGRDASIDAYSSSQEVDGLHLNQAGLYVVQCSAAQLPCSKTVRLNGSTSSKYYVRIQSFYNPVSAVTLNSFKGGVGAVNDIISVKTSQKIIDATGKSNGVLRRIQVRVATGSSTGFSNSFTSSFAIQSADSICKRLLVPVVSEDVSTDSSDPECAVSGLNY